MSERIVFLPGFLCDETLWRFQAAAFSPAYDIQIVDFKVAQNLDEMVKQIEKAAQGQVHLVGFSMGGHLAQVFASHYPERIKTLSLVAANVGPLSARTRDSRLKLAGMLKNANYKGMSPKELSKYVHPDSEAQPEITEAIIRMSAGYNSQMYINQMMATIDREDLSHVVEGLKVPVLIVGGDSDKVVPLETLQDFHERITDSKFEVVAKSGHYIPLEQPEKLTAILGSFLNSQN